MKRPEVITKLCKIVSRVYQEGKNFSHASDCFCSEDPHGGRHFQHEGKTLEFVRQAVAEKLAKENPNFDLQFYLKMTE